MHKIKQSTTKNKIYICRKCGADFYLKSIGCHCQHDWTLKEPDPDAGASTKKINPKEQDLEK